jgi:hypothetical protein
MKIKKEVFLSAGGIFIIYLVVLSLLILAFRLVFPSEAAPLQGLSFHWRLNEGILDIVGLFPALAMSALVVPVGLRNAGEEEFASFSPLFLKRLKGSIITAISAVVLYGILFFLVLPLAEDYRSNMRFEGLLFRLAKDRATEYADREEWVEASQFIAICERIWPESPEIAHIRIETAINLDELRISRAASWAQERYNLKEQSASPYSTGVPGRQAVDAADALALADTALREERFYDAHWLATLAGRLARSGSFEANNAARLASQAWNAISSMAPNAREVRSYNLYRLKREGYEAMIAEDWIRGYYIFKDLAVRVPEDSDVAAFLASCEDGISRTAFFIDEMELTLGEILTGAVFSVPVKSPRERRDGRLILRINSLSTFADYSYGVGVEILAFGGEGQLLYHVEAPYAKLVPMTLGDEPRLILMMRVLDRNDPDIRWEPVWSGPERSAIGDAQIMLDLVYEDFLLLAKTERGMDKLLIGDLFNAERKLGAYGYVPQIFQAEIVYRVSEPAFLLPMSILALLIGWRFRAKKRPRYMSYLMLAVLPLVFNGWVHLYRSFLNALGIWSVVSFGFSGALFLFSAGIFLIFILILIGLAAQR